MTDEVAAHGARLRRLTAILTESPRVRRLAATAPIVDPEDVAAEAADGLLDIQHAADNLCNALLPRLERQDPAIDLDDLLDDIAEELRHIYYHVANTRLFNYVVPLE